MDNLTIHSMNLLTLCSKLWWLVNKNEKEMEGGVRDIDLPRVFRNFLEGLRKIITKSVRINGFCYDINPEKL
jgi:hypothetical protein